MRFIMPKGPFPAEEVKVDGKIYVNAHRVTQLLKHVPFMRKDYVHNFARKCGWRSIQRPDGKGNGTWKVYLKEDVVAYPKKINSNS